MCTFQTVRKKRSEVASSFFKCLFFIVRSLFEIESDLVIQVMDILARQDLYKPPRQVLGVASSLIKPLESSDNALPELEKIKHFNEVANLVIPSDLLITQNGVFTQSPLQPEQLVCVASGFIGLSDEFSYDKGIDNSQYALFGTKFIVDLTNEEPQFALNFRRSLSPNCIIKLFTHMGELHVGIFAGVSEANGIDNRTRREKFVINANTELTLPIDFPPGTLIEPMEFMNWHFEETELIPEPPSSPPPAPPPQPIKEAPRRGRPPKDPFKIDRMEVEKPKPKKKYNKVKEEKETKIKLNKKKMGRDKNVENDANNTFMFNLFKTEEAGVPLLEICAREMIEEDINEYDDTDDEEYMGEHDEVPIKIVRRKKRTRNDEEEDEDVIPDLPVDLSFLDEMRVVGDCSFEFIPPSDPKGDFLEVIHS